MWVRLLALTAFAGGCAGTLPTSAPSSERPAPSAPRVISIGSVTVDVDGRFIEVPGQVNMSEGCVELLACGPGGKTHESVFVVHASPTDFHAAILLLGLRPGTAPDLALGLGPEGPAVGILVSWEQDGRQVKIEAEQTLFNTADNTTFRDAGWAFTGSEVVDGFFMAEVEESFVATYWDRWAILNLSHPAGIDDTLIFANPEVLPPKDTEVVMRFEVSGAGR
jgi:hypothetical protein